MMIHHHIVATEIHRRLDRSLFQDLGYIRRWFNRFDPVWGAVEVCETCEGLNNIGMEGGPDGGGISAGSPWK